MGFSRQEYWSVLPFPSPWDLPNPGIEPGSPALQTDTLPSEPSKQRHPCYSRCWISYLFKNKHYPAACADHILFLHSSADGYLANAAQNTHIQIPECPISVLLGLYPGAELPDHMVILIFWRTTGLFSTVAAPCCIVTDSTPWSSFSTSSPTVGINVFCLFESLHHNGCAMLSHGALQFIWISEQLAFSGRNHWLNLVL